MIELNIAPARLRAYLNYFWEGHLKNHFLNEDVLLFNMIDEPVCVQAKNDHIAISTQIENLNTFAKDDLSAYKRFADLLSNHIRFEERIAFPYLEEKLSDAKLHGVSHFLEKDHIDDFRDEYSDEFWIKKKESSNG
ncbi:hemerythrin domain-containing protein [Pedobacter sp. NJ-S-72]